MGIAPESSGNSQPSDMVDFQQRSMWPATTQALMKTDKRRELLQPTIDLEQLLERDVTFADEQRFEDLMRSSKAAISHRDSLARMWKNHQANAVGLLREQLDALQQRRIESDRKKKEIIDEHAAECDFSCPGGDEVMLDPVSIGEGFMCNSDAGSSWSSIPDSASSLSEYEGENSSDFWREKAKTLDTLLTESHRREELLTKKLQDAVAEFPSRSMGELQQQFERFDNFLRFTVRKAPIVFGHQDTELRYRFIHNAFPTLTEEEVIGKTDEEIYQGMGVSELMEFKREVIRTKVPDKQEIKFNTNMFGYKTFMIAVEPVLDINDVCVGVNYVAMDVTLQVAKREKLAKIQAEDAVQVAMESELNKTIFITEESMRAKQMLATMAHEIRSPLSGVISTASVLARTSLNQEQKRYIEFMTSSGNVVLKLINDILDLSKVEAGAMTFEEKKFRPREVVKHVLQMASASVAADNKTIHLETDVSDDVPLEVVGDVLRIRQVLTNLVSNAVKFTHEGKVSIVVRVVGPSSHTARDHTTSKRKFEFDCCETSQQTLELSAFPYPMAVSSSPEASNIFQRKGLIAPISTPVSNNATLFSEANQRTLVRKECGFFSDSIAYKCCGTRDTGIVKISSKCQRSEMTGDVPSALENQRTGEQICAIPSSNGNAGDQEALVRDQDRKNVTWIEFYIIDTGIGISEGAIPTLFKRYAQASSTHARKYGGTGLGLHICKQLVELMGGHISVLSKEKEGSTFSFKLPLRTIQQLPSSPVSSDELKCVAEKDHRENTCTDAPGVSRLSSKKPAHKNFQYPSSRGRGRRRSKQSLKPAFNTPSPTNSDQLEHFTACCSQNPELHSVTVPNPAVVTKPVHSEEHEHCLGPTTSRLLDSQGPPEHAFFEPIQGFDREDLPKSGSRSNTSLTKKIQRGSARYETRSSPEQSNARKLGRTYPDNRISREPSQEKNSGRFKILVAEDDPVNIRVATQMMVALGHELKVVNNGADAVQAVKQESYDVVLMDVHMPVMDGLEATRHIRMYEESCSSAPTSDIVRSHQGATTASDLSLQRIRRIPIIAMTADALTDNIQECAKNGMDNFIAKPVNLEKLEELLNEYVPSRDQEF